jgi:leucyl aminopeptidase
MNNLVFNLLKEKPQLVNAVFLVNSFDKLDKNIFSDREIDFIQHQIAQDAKLIPLNYFYHWNFIVVTGCKNDCDDEAEALRRTGIELADFVNKNELDFLTIVDNTNAKEPTIALVEGLLLSLYRFDKYKNQKNRKKELKRLNIFNPKFIEVDIEELDSIMHATSFTRDLVNEPASTLTATRFCRYCYSRSS